ncbi:MAG TPA: amino acid adenylation domain-containing protein [Herpetosiphonaceae bacterium]
MLRLSADEHVLLLTMHHSVADGWSMGGFFLELSALYAAAIGGTAPVLPPLPIQYADYAVWQRDWLQGAVLERQLNYWRQQLADLPVLELPTDHPRPPIPSLRGALHRFTLPKALSDELVALSRREGVTLFMTLLTAWQVLLSRYSGQHDIAVGTPIAGRTHAETEGLIGFFVNTLVLRADLSGNPSFHQLLRQVREVCLSAYAHQDLPFEQLIEALQPERDLSRNPLFQVMFALQNAPLSALTLPGLTLSPVEVANEIAKFDLTLNLEEGPEGLSGWIEYSTELFEAATITRLLGHYQMLLAGIVADPNRRLADLTLLDAAERRQLLVLWNDTQLAYPSNAGIHQLFEAQAARTPNAAAVIFEERQLTYGELNVRANQLAHYLRAHGVGPEVRVGLCVERSLDLIVGLLGILKAGGAYVPLDPAYPAQRLALMLADTQAPLILTRQAIYDAQRPLFEGLPQDANPAATGDHQAKAINPTVICLDSDWTAIAGESEANPGSSVGGDSLAYVMYTSGSTGLPKGVSVTHRNVIRLVSSPNYARLSADDVFLQFAPISFDAATLEVWGALLNGARLVVFPAGTPSLAELGQALERYQVTILWLTAGLFHQMVDNQLDSLRSVRQLLAGGDVLSVPHVQKVLRTLDGCQLINGYGPTENTTFTCCYPMRHGEQVGLSVPIGRPISNTRVYVLDRHLKPVPVGVSGELYAGGDGVGRGYLNRPDLTAERFVPDPFGDPGARLYRTGDLVRYRPDGNLEFLGRRDAQVKLRGYRIELGEIEAVLLRHPAVQECAVLVREDVPGDRRLVAYVVEELRTQNLEPGIEQRTENKEQSSIAGLPSPTATEAEASRGLGQGPRVRATTESLIPALRAFVQAELPAYMVPAAFVVLPALPLSPNGKLERRALPAPDAAWSTLDDSFVAPQSPIEEVLAGIWAGVLRLERVGIHDNFFALGGHSLLATQVISRIREAFQVELPLRALFEAPTVAQLAERIVAVQRDAQGLLPPPIRPVSRDEALPLSFAQQRLWFLDQLEPDSSTYTIPAAWRLEGPLDVIALRQSLTTIVERHEALRTTFTTTADGQPVQAITPPQVVPLPLIDLHGLSASERESVLLRLAGTEARQPFDLARGPLIRTTLLRLAETDHVLLLTMHHIVSDGWSMEVFARELVPIYTALIAGMPPSLAQLPIQYADYAVWQRGWLSGTVLEAQLGYWRRQLAGLPVLELPTDRPRPALPTFRGARQTFALPAALSKELVALSQREGVTLFMTLLAAWQVLLDRYSGQHDIVVGTPIANRTQEETEHLIGFFVNTLVLRADLSGNPTFRDVLHRVRETALGAYAHQDLPFEQVVDALQPERDLSRHPLFQVMFTLQNVPMVSLELPSLVLNPLPIEYETTKFDLTLSMAEEGSGLVGSLEYTTDLFEAETIGRMVSHLQTLLAGIVRDPSQRLAQLPLLTEAERRQLTVDWNMTEVAYPRGRCIHELVAAQAARTPDAVALVYAAGTRERVQLTYEELDRRANQLAHELQALGVGPEVRVGVCVERSLDLIVGLLGILKAGGAYVPLDPAYPAQRVAFMLADSAVPVILSQQSLASNLPAHNGVVVCLDSDWERISRQPTDAPATAVEDNNLAYVIYTSGSTGRPKGVAITHQSAATFIHWALNTFSGADLARVAAGTSICFDLSIFELFVPLSCGGTVLLIDDGLQIPELIDAQVTLLNTVPSVMAAVLRSGSVPPSVRVINLAGEPLSRALADGLYQAVPTTRVYNLYGPSEDTTYSTYTLVAPHEPRPPTIGRPIANSQAYVLDAQMQPVPIGAVGELYLGGVGLARGYLGRPDLTAEKFIPDPFSAAPNARLYRTGDRARYRPDGAIEFLGRIDHQVKLRGFRIELGEIEAALSRYPAVQEAVVLIREDHPPAGGHAEQRLVAYVVPTADQRPALTDAAADPDRSSFVADLRAFVKQHLPDYMVPNSVVLLDALPLLPNGKIDRPALPAPALLRPELEAGFAAPETPVETRLAQIWAEVLRLPQVGIRNNFFALGGDSILSIQIVARARQAGLQLTPRQIFQYQTIAELAAVAGTTTAVTAEQGLVTGPVPLTPIQHWFFEHESPERHHYNQAMLLEVRQPLDLTLLHRAIRQLLRHHDALRLRFVQAVEGWQQINAGMDDQPIVSSIDLAALPATEQARALEAAASVAQASLSLTTGPLVRAVHFSLGPGRTSRLLLVIHHLAVDTVSWQILLEDLQTAYAQLQRGALVTLPPKTTPFQQWAERLADYAQSEALRQELAYWSGAGRVSVRLPLDFPRGANTVASAASVETVFSVEETRALLQEVPAVYQTQINDVLLTALVQAFGRWTGTAALLIELEGHGREEIFEDVDLTRTVGWFTTLYPVLLDLRRVIGQGAALKAIKEQLRQVPSRGIGYGLLRYLHRDRAINDQLGSLPAAEINFNYHGQVDQTAPSGGLFDLAREPRGSSQSLRGMRRHLLEINGMVAEGRLRLTWTYSTALHSRATIERLSQGYQAALRALIAHCQSSDAGGYTPSDFPDMKFGQKALDDIIAKLSEFVEEED